jgi:hypothetical protein
MLIPSKLWGLRHSAHCSVTTSVAEKGRYTMGAALDVERVLPPQGSILLAGSDCGSPVPDRRAILDEMPLLLMFAAPLVLEDAPSICRMYTPGKTKEEHVLFTDRLRALILGNTT